jgi:GntR family transcriptional regulator, galactonate operon transcriptional repressor
VGAIAEGQLDQVRALLRRANLHDHIVEALGVRIVRGEFSENAVLPTEPALAAELGVGRNALREAIKVLASKGLVEVRPKTGTRVLARERWNLLDRSVLGWMTQSGQQLQHALGLVEFRLIFEPKASYLAALRATQGERAAILSTCDDLEGSLGKPLDMMSEIDLRFHRAILRASHNDILFHLGSLIESLMKIQVVATSQDQAELAVGVQQHRDLANAIAAGDAAAAEEASRALVMSPYVKLSESFGTSRDLMLRSNN